MNTKYEAENDVVRETVEQPPIVTVYERSDIGEKLAASIARRDQKILELDGAQQEVDKLQSVFDKFPEQSPTVGEEFDMIEQDKS